VDQSGQAGIIGKSLLIRQADTKFGRDPRQADLVIPEKSVSPLHAMLHITENNGFILSDLNSTAGTWVNFAPITSNGVHLEHNDLVNFGKASYRFETLKSPSSSQLPPGK